TRSAHVYPKRSSFRRFDTRLIARAAQTGQFALHRRRSSISYNLLIQGKTAVTCFNLDLLSTVYAGSAIGVSGKERINYYLGFRSTCRIGVPGATASRMEVFAWRPRSIACTRPHCE